MRKKVGSDIATQVGIIVMQGCRNGTTVLEIRQEVEKQFGNEVAQLVSIETLSKTLHFVNVLDSIANTFIGEEKEEKTETISLKSLMEQSCYPSEKDEEKYEENNDKCLNNLCKDETTSSDNNKDDKEKSILELIEEIGRLSKQKLQPQIIRISSPKDLKKFFDNFNK
jgi:hypothetical protein